MFNINIGSGCIINHMYNFDSQFTCDWFLGKPKMNTILLCEIITINEGNFVSYTFLTIYPLAMKLRQIIVNVQATFEIHTSHMVMWSIHASENPLIYLYTHHTENKKYYIFKCISIKRHLYSVYKKQYIVTPLLPTWLFKNL